MYGSFCLILTRTDLYLLNYLFGLIYTEYWQCKKVHTIHKRKRIVAGISRLLQLCKLRHHW